jgi:hypothetical protein
MRPLNIAGLIVASAVFAGCATVAPVGTSPTSPGATLVATSTSGAFSSTSPPSGLATVAPPTASSAAEATPTARPPRKTPKPTKKPRPTPSPTPSPISGDIEVSIEQSSVPDPFYAGTDYAIRVYISALGQQDLPNVRVKLVAKDEGVSYRFETGPIKITDSYYHDVTVNLPAYGPSALTLSASMPDGYVDINKANNTKSVDIFVQAQP